MDKIRLVLSIVVAVVILSLGTTVTIMGVKLKSMGQDLSYAVANEKALLLKNDSVEGEARSLQLTTEQLRYFNDSIIDKLNDARLKLKVKDSEIKELQYLHESIKSVDTIVYHDTIFAEALDIDTVIGDRWHQVDLHLAYPNSIVVSPSFESDKTIVSYLKKETINPPKKCAFARLFQKKHKVIVTHITENNPYVTTKEYMHIEIVK